MNRDLVRKVGKRTIIVSLIIILFIFFIFQDPMKIVKGFIFGTLISILSFKLIQLTVEKSVNMDPKRARSYTISQYFIRYFIYFLVLATAALADYLSFPGAALGLLMTKFTILLSAVLDKDFKI